MSEIEKPLKSANMHEVVQEWYANYVDVDQELLFELILAANYMDIKLAARPHVRDRRVDDQGQDAEEIRKTFNIASTTSRPRRRRRSARRTSGARRPKRAARGARRRRARRGARAPLVRTPHTRGRSAGPATARRACARRVLWRGEHASQDLPRRSFCSRASERARRAWG